MNTPWGQSQTQKTIANGIVLVSTASHGGMILSTDKYLEFKKLFPNFTPYAGDYFFEEDCDWAMVAIAFPEHFNNQDLFNAVRTTKYESSGLNFPLDFWNTKQGKQVLTRANYFEMTLANHSWEVLTMSCGSQPGWNILLGRLDQKKNVQFKTYPEKQFYSDKELETLIY